MSGATVNQMLLSGYKTLSWFEVNRKEILSKYDNKFVAFEEEKIIESDSKLDNLIKKLQSRKINPASVLIKFVSKIKSIL